MSLLTFPSIVVVVQYYPGFLLLSSLPLSPPTTSGINQSQYRPARSHSTARASLSSAFCSCETLSETCLDPPSLEYYLRIAIPICSSQNTWCSCYFPTIVQSTSQFSNLDPGSQHSDLLFPPPLPLPLPRRHAIITCPPLHLPTAHTPQPSPSYLFAGHLVREVSITRVRTSPQDNELPQPHFLPSHRSIPTSSSTLQIPG